MKKVLFLMLFLLVLGAAGTNAQVRIGGDEAPNVAAVLDLNVDDDTNTGTKGLALPRVSLASNKDKLVYSDLLEGMLVYNTNAGMTDGDGIGVYYWDGSEWVKSAGGSVYEGSTSIVQSGNSFQRAELTGDVTAAANSNVTTIANNAVKTAMIANGAVTRGKTSFVNGTLKPTLSGTTVGSWGNVSTPAGCDGPLVTFAWTNPESVVCGWNQSNVIQCVRWAPGTIAPTVYYTCML